MMRILYSAGACAVAAFLALPATPAEAQPAGSYQESCRRIREVGDRRNPILTAQCLDTRKRWRDTTLAYRSCQRGGIVNDNGRLACARGGGGGGAGWGGGNGGPGWGNGNGGGNGGPGWGGGNRLPGGSWRQSCEPRDFARGVLTARCDDGRGNRRETTLNMRSCPTGQAGNAYGRLVCQ